MELYQDTIKRMTNRLVEINFKNQYGLLDDKRYTEEVLAISTIMAGSSEKELDTTFKNYGKQIDC